MTNVTRVYIASVGSALVIHLLWTLRQIVLYRYKLVLDSDAEQYGGHKRLDSSVDFYTTNEPWDNRRCSLMVSVDFHTTNEPWDNRRCSLMVRCIYCSTF